jgi:hypothetical protein
LSKFLDQLLTGLVEAAKEAAVEELKNVGIDLNPPKAAKVNPDPVSKTNEAGEQQDEDWIDPTGSIDTEGETVPDEPKPKPKVK